MEHCSDFKHSKQTEIKIKNTSAIIARVFMVLFVLSAISLLAYLGVSVHSFISNDDASLLSILYPTIQLATACITLRLMYTLFRNIANGRSPLTKKHARILAIIASLLLVSCLVEIVMQLIPAVSEHIFQVGSFAEVGYVQDPATSSLHIDLKPRSWLHSATPFPPCFLMEPICSSYQTKQFKMSKIIIDIDSAMRLKGLNNKKLAAILGLTEVHVSRLKNTNIKAIRLDTLNSLCEVLECEPGDIIKRIS